MKTLLLLLICSSLICLRGVAEHVQEGRRNPSDDKDPAVIRAFAQRIEDLEKSFGGKTDPQAVLEHRIESLEGMVVSVPETERDLVSRLKRILNTLPIESVVEGEGLLSATVRAEKFLWGPAYRNDGDGLVVRVENIERKMTEKQAGLGLRARIDALEHLLVRIADVESKLDLTPDKSRSVAARLEAMEKRKKLTPGKDDSFQKRISRLEKSL